MVTACEVILIAARVNVGKLAETPDARPGQLSQPQAPLMDSSKAAAFR
jgi:hypothetical protein